jgi:hypothetical protein
MVLQFLPSSKTKRHHLYRGIRTSSRVRELEAGSSARCIRSTHTDIYWPIHHVGVGCVPTEPLHHTHGRLAHTSVREGPTALAFSTEPRRNGLSPEWGLRASAIAGKCANCKPNRTTKQRPLEYFRRSRRVWTDQPHPSSHAYPCRCLAHTQAYSSANS